MNKCLSCGEEIEGGVVPWAKHHNKCGVIVYDPSVPIDFDAAFKEMFDKAEKERKEAEKNRPSYDELIKGIKTMEDDKCYQIPYHPMFKGFYLGKFWKVMYEVT